METFAEVDLEAIDNRALQHLLKHVGDAVVIAPAQRTTAGDWIVPVLASTGERLGELCYAPSGKLITQKSTLPETL